jgi:predicted phosphodiesterase
MQIVNTLVIADTHIPFEHPEYLAFCKRIEKAFNCKRVVHIGDLVDNHAISYHEVDPDGWSPEDEMKQADKHLEKWFKAFPNVYVCLGNHDRLPDRKGKTIGLPRRCFRSFREMWKLPEGWKDDFEWEFNGVLFKHGTGASGKYSHIQSAIDARQSCVIGHTHATAGVEYIANSKDIMFGMNVGCGIHRKTYAFAYGRDFRRKPIVGCGVVTATKYGVNAQFLPMAMK